MYIKHTGKDLNLWHIVLETTALPDWATDVYVGADGFEPTIRADYRFYRPAPNQFVRYTHLYYVEMMGIEPTSTILQVSFAVP